MNKLLITLATLALSSTGLAFDFGLKGVVFKPEVWKLSEETSFGFKGDVGLRLSNGFALNLGLSPTFNYKLPMGTVYAGPSLEVGLGSFVNPFAAGLKLGGSYTLAPGFSAHAEAGFYFLGDTGANFNLGGGYAINPCLSLGADINFNTRPFGPATSFTVGAWGRF